MLDVGTSTKRGIKFHYLGSQMGVFWTRRLAMRNVHVWPVPTVSFFLHKKTLSSVSKTKQISVMKKGVRQRLKQRSEINGFNFNGVRVWCVLLSTQFG